MLEAKLEEAIAGRGQIVGISADAGMGKSRLATECARKAGDRGAVVAVGECQSYGTNTSYFAWRGVWSTLFHLDTAQAETEQVQALEAELAAIDPGLVPRAPLLASLLDLPIADNALTAQFDAKLRKTSLEGLLVECLRARAIEAPLVLVLEDCQWLDPLSRDLLEVLGRALADLRVLIVLAYRPSANARWQARHRKPRAFHRDGAPGARRRGCGAVHPVDAFQDRAGGNERSRRTRGAHHRQGAGQSLLHRGAAQFHP